MEGWWPPSHRFPVAVSSLITCNVNPGFLETPLRLLFIWKAPYWSIKIIKSWLLGEYHPKFHKAWFIHVVYSYYPINSPERSPRFPRPIGMGPDAGGAAGALRSSPGRTVPGEHGGRRGQEALRRCLQEGRLGSGHRGSRFPLNGIMGLYWYIFIFIYIYIKYIYIYQVYIYIYIYIYWNIYIYIYMDYNPTIWVNLVGEARKSATKWCRSCETVSGPPLASAGMASDVANPAKLVDENPIGLEWKTTWFTRVYSTKSTLC